MRLKRYVLVLPNSICYISHTVFLSLSYMIAAYGEIRV
jgi:hypothetical protein